MTGFIASSSEHYSGVVDLEIHLDASDAAAIVTVEDRVRTFVKALEAGFFFPGARVGTGDAVASASPGVILARLEVDAIPRTAFDVLGGLLLDCVYNEVFSIRSARAILRNETRDLLAQTSRRPAAPAHPPFIVELPADTELGNNTLLVEIEFADVVPPEVGAQRIDELALIEDLWLAYPIEDEDEGVEPLESLGAQRHFNDPRTIHHHEFSWDADPTSWNLLVNLCCVWSRTTPVRRLHIE